MLCNRHQKSLKWNVEVKSGRSKGRRCWPSFGAVGR